MYFVWHPDRRRVFGARFSTSETARPREEVSGVMIGTVTLGIQPTT
jgi:hypothetical protein